jgi:hypothetical protein
MRRAVDPSREQEEDIVIVFRFVSIPVPSSPTFPPLRFSLCFFTPHRTGNPTDTYEGRQNRPRSIPLQHLPSTPRKRKARALRPPNMSNVKRRTFVSKAYATGDDRRESSEHVHCHTSYNIKWFHTDLNYVDVCLIVVIDFRYFGGSVYILYKHAVMELVRRRWIRDLLRLRGTC